MLNKMSYYVWWSRLALILVRIIINLLHFNTKNTKTNSDFFIYKLIPALNIQRLYSFMMAKPIFGRVIRLINFSLLIVCIINSCDVINRLVNPELPTIHVINTNLKDRDVQTIWRMKKYAQIRKHIWINVELELWSICQLRID